MKKLLKIFFAAAIIAAVNVQLSTLSAQDAIYNLIRRDYSVNSDGSIDMRYRKEIKLLRNRAITAYADKGETFILYNPAYDKLTINESYTIRPDGSRVPTPANAFIDQLPSQCADCGRFNGMREKVVVHTALEYDCIVVLDYTIHHQGSSGWAEVIDLVQDCPVKRYEVTIDAADGVRWEATPTGDNSRLKTIADGHSYHLMASKLEQNAIENYAATNYPRLTVNLGKVRTESEASHSEPLPEVENIIAELFEKEPAKWAANIRDYVHDYIRTVDIKSRYIDSHMASPKETFLSNCGLIEEKNDLLAAMLRQAGFSATSTGKMVELTLIENGNSLTYTLSADNKRTMRLQGAALDEQRTISIARQLPWKGSAIGGGYQSMDIPVEEGSINIDPVWLTSERKTALHLRNCDEQYRYSIAVPRGTRLVNPVDISYSKSGIGSIRISIRQTDDSTIEVLRKLDVNVADGNVTTKQYKNFRKMMQDWHHYSKIVIK